MEKEKVNRRDILAVLVPDIIIIIIIIIVVDDVVVVIIMYLDYGIM